ncbi:ribonuclease VapC [Thermococcus siculi]|uniref:Ribonuclease VapC n=1 Tax=Thermococcus siculi TaxID=72803 RepID=A0A2Z2MNE2_9EURY|nr:type II toxin-antitoxin system VapC family toxin [Thermococcus siculi]ASJ08184.1 ribonuclease VapC [Thermococcus siculi]
MSGNVFFDSNVLIYHLSGISKAKALVQAAEDGVINGFINPIVTSEVLFFYIKANTGMKSYELKKHPETLSKLDLEPVFELFSVFKILDLNSDIVKESRHYIENSMLLPNDALIASTCSFYGIPMLATFDDDFKRVHGLKTIQSLEDI